MSGVGSMASAIGCLGIEADGEGDRGESSFMRARI